MTFIVAHFSWLFLFVLSVAVAQIVCSPSYVGVYVVVSSIVQVSFSGVIVSMISCVFLFVNSILFIPVHPVVSCGPE